MGNFAYNSSEGSESLPAFTFRVSGNLVHIRKFSRAECHWVHESFPPTEEDGKWKALGECALDFQDSKGRGQLM